MLKKIIAVLTIMIMCISLMPFTTFGITTTPIIVTADKEKVVKGDIVTFAVSYGAVEQTLGSSEFEIVIPEGLEYIEKSCVLTNNLATILGVEKAEFTESTLKFVSSMSNEGYSSTDELQILTFKCKVTANSENKTVTVNVNDFSSDGYYNYADMPSKVIPATISIKSEITEISLNKDTVTIEKGKSQTITATINPIDAIDKSIIWESSDESIATVNEGTITAVSKGKAVITAKTKNNLIATCEVIVTQPIEKIMLNESILQLQEEQTVSLTATISPINADGDKTINWTSNNSDVAIVDENGNVTAIGRGTAVITATTQNNITAKCNIIVGIPLEAIYLNETDKEIRNGDSYTFSVIYNPTNTDASKEVTWTSSDEQVATVDKNGKVMVNSCEGTAIITATSVIDSTKKATATITALHKDSEFTYHPAKESTCTEKGNVDYYECSGCGRKYKDSKGSQELEDVSIQEDINAHDWEEWKIVKEPTCDENGKKERVCKHNIEHKESQSISKLSHSIVLVSEKEPTCCEAGYIKHYECEYCHKYFKDSIGEIELSIEDIQIEPLKHNLVKVDKKTATCSSEGNIDYWYCSDCGKKFSDSEGQNEITDVTIPVDSEAHDWEDWIVEIEPSKDIVGKRTRICKNNPFHIETEYLYSVTYIYTDNNTLTIKANGNIEDLICLLVDDNELDEDCYILKSGSTIVILNKDYINTLENGEHTLTFVYINGKVDASFEVEKIVEEKDDVQEITEKEEKNTNYEYIHRNNYRYTTGNSNEEVKNTNSENITTSEQSNTTNGYVITNLKKVAKKDNSNKDNTNNKDNNQEELKDNNDNEDYDEVNNNDNDIKTEDIKDLSKKSNHKVLIISIFIVLALILIIAIIIVIKYKSNSYGEEDSEVIKENDKKEIEEKEEK